MTALAAAAAPAQNAITVEPPRPTITTVSDVSIGLNIASQTDALWDDYDISLTGDSGVIMGPISGDPVTTLQRFKLRNIGGRAGGPAWAVHGIYCKRPNTVIEDFDAEVSSSDPDNTDALTLRRRGIVVNRFRAIPSNNSPFAMSYFEEDTVAGTVTIKNGVGTVAYAGGGGTGIWISLNTSPNVIQAFWFENVHFTVAGANPKFASSSAGEYTGAGVTIKNCTLNGAKVQSSMVTNLGTPTIIND